MKGGICQAADEMLFRGSGRSVWGVEEELFP